MKTYKWKQIAPVCMAAAMIMVAPVQTYAVSPEFARTEEEWAKLRDNVMEYGELSGLIHEYNATVQTNQSNYNKEKNKTAEDIAQDLRNQAEDIENGIEYGEDAASIAAAKMAQTSADRLRKQADENVSDSQLLKLGYDQAEDTLVSTAQSLMISYYQKDLDIQIAVKNREKLAVEYEAAVAKANAGTGTQLEVLTAKESLQTADANMITDRAELQNTKQKLCVMLGWQYDANPEILAVPEADINKIASINPQNDKEEAIANSYLIRTNLRKLDNTTVTADRETLQVTINDNKQTVGSALVSAYQSVLQAKAAYDQALAEEAAEATTLSAARAKYKAGTISRLQLVQQEATYVTKSLNVKKANMSLFQSMETYNWTVKGLSGV